MRKIFFQMAVSLDGYFEGIDKSIDWHKYDEELNDHIMEMADTTDLMIFGRTTYELMKAAFTNPQLIRDEPEKAKMMNDIPKIVVSRTLDKVDWGDNSTLLKGDMIEEIKKIKNQPGKEITVGGSNLALTLIEHGLIDEFRLVYTPVFLGKGHSLFEGLKDKVELKLLKSKAFKSGNVVHYYQPGKIKFN